MVCFNNHNREGHWGVAEWDFFVTDVARHLKPDGRIWLALNRQLDGSFMTAELAAMFESRGAEISRHEVVFNSAPRASTLAEHAVR